MFLTSTDMAVVGGFTNATPPESSELWFMIIIIAAVVVFLVGLLKKAIVLCIIGGLISAWLGFSGTENFNNMTNSISSKLDEAIDPFKDEDNYGDVLDKSRSAVTVDFGDISVEI